MSEQNLISEFHTKMLEVYDLAKKECDYSATLFLRMVNTDGGLQAAKKLIAKSAVSDGFSNLAIAGRLDISMEALILREPWTQLFTEQERDIAKKRLRDYGHTPT